MKDLRDRVAVVTGAASGIGRALADRFAAEGMKLVLADVEEGPLESAARELEAKGALVRVVRADVAKAADVVELADTAFAAFGGVHVLCNNAGVAAPGFAWELSLGEWEWVLGVNLWGVIHGIRSFVPRMIEQGAEGHVVNTASIAGMFTTPLLGPYGVTKHAVVALSETMHHELALIGLSIKVSVLCPGFVQTRIADSSRNRPAGAAGTATNPIAQTVDETVRQLVDAGIAASIVADRVVEAIRDERFYVFTHPELVELVRVRLGRIVEGKPPAFDSSVLGIQPR